MEIDISSLNIDSSIEVSSSVNIPKELLKDSDIKDLKNLEFNGILSDNQEIFTLTGVLKGVMTVLDAINLEEIDYEFSCDIDEEIEDFSEKSSNLLDITDILWQNIILEVPLKLTNVSNFDEYHGDGWKLVSEDSKEITNNPFKELEEMLREE
jgi:uncharacterized protein